MTWGRVLKRKLARHSKLETGIDDRNNPVDFATLPLVPPSGTCSFGTSLNKWLLATCVWCKFYSCMVNVSVDPECDFMVSSKQTDRRPQVNMDSHDSCKNFYIVAVIKLRHQLKLANQ
jgi:hypothetical protein